MKKHAKLSASGAERWMACPASVSLSALAPPRPDNPSALEGTRAHACLEALLNVGSSRMSVMAAMLRRENPDEMVNHALDAALYIRGEVKGPLNGGSLLFIEEEVSLEFIEPDMFGTPDAIIVNEYETLHVIDYKYGKKVVDPKKCAQLIYYALATAHKFDYNFSDIILTIIQPRALTLKKIRHWQTDIAELLLWAEAFKIAALETKMPNPPLYEGRWCWYCPANQLSPSTGEMICPLMRAKRVDDFNYL